MTSRHGNGSDQLLYRGLYVSANEIRRAEAVTDSQACKNSTTSVLTLNASERLYQLISLFTHFYQHDVENRLFITLTTSLAISLYLYGRSVHDTQNNSG